LYNSQNDNLFPKSFEAYELESHALLRILGFDVIFLTLNSSEHQEF